MKSSIKSIILLLPILVACGAPADELSGGVGDPNNPGGGGPGSTDPNNPNPPDPNDPAVITQTCTTEQRQYVGFGGTKLVDDRAQEVLGADRGRVKSFQVYSDDVTRAFGRAPQLLGQSGATFGASAARWYDEPKSGAVVLYQAFRVAFQGCTEFTKDDAKFANAPDEASAATVCTEFENKFWSRTPTPEEVNACVSAAVQGSAKLTADNGTMSDTPARQRWAYTCASVLASANFLTY